MKQIICSPAREAGQVWGAVREILRVRVIEGEWGVCKVALFSEMT